MFTISMKKLFQKFASWLNQPSNPNTLSFDEMDAECPECQVFQPHKIERSYLLVCSRCGNQQHKKEALTREDTAW
jgi:uncharacterized paraquat-inducible protein A